jgi:hypothetical protein
MSSDLSLAQHTALSFLLTQHNSDLTSRESAKVEVVVVRNAEPKASKKSAKPSKNEAAPIHDGPKVFGVTMPERNSLDAKGYLLAMRTAGKRVSDKGVPFTDPKEVRNDQIKAIHAFVGYDSHGNFGSQEMLATAKANRDLRGVQVVTGPTREEQRAASRSAAGYVAGLPDHKARHLQNLLGQEALEAEAMIEHEKLAMDPSRPMADRLLSKGMVELQEEKLRHIRAAIAAYR